MCIRDRLSAHPSMSEGLKLCRKHCNHKIVGIFAAPVSEGLKYTSLSILLLQLQRIVAITSYCNCNRLCKNFMLGHYAYCIGNGSLSTLLFQLQLFVAVTSNCNCNGLCRMLGHYVYCNCKEL